MGHERHDGNRAMRQIDRLDHKESWAICHFFFCFSTYKFVHLLWHFYGFRMLLSCQHCSTALTLSFNYTITLLCTVDLVVKYLKCSSTAWIFKNIV